MKNLLTRRYMRIKICRGWFYDVGFWDVYENVSLIVKGCKELETGVKLIGPWPGIGPRRQ